MFEAITLVVTAINLIISTAGSLKYLPEIVPQVLAVLIAAGGAVFTGLWIGVFGLWLEWWPLMAAFSVLGFFGVLHQYRFLMNEARQRKLMRRAGY